MWRIAGIRLFHGGVVMLHCDCEMGIVVGKRIVDRGRNVGFVVMIVGK